MSKPITQIELTPRPELERFEPYQPGLSIEQIRRQHGLKKIIKLASNENPLGASPKGMSAYKSVMKDIFRYPESRSVDLRQIIADQFKLDVGQVIIGAGSDEIIELMGKSYLTPQDEIVISVSSFTQYRIIGDMMGSHVKVVPMKNLKHDLKAMASAVSEKTKLMFIANPNNPTGTYNTRDEVEEFLSILPSHVLPIFDEAYYEYASVEEDYPSVVDEFFSKRPLMVLRTFSKIYGLAGLRVGYGIGPDVCIQTMDKIRSPFNVSLPAQAAAQEALFDIKFLEKSVDMNEQEKDFLEKSLTEMGFKVVSSAANFLLFNVQPLTGRTLFNRLLQKGVIARAVDEYALPDYLRITIGTRSDNKFFLKALQEVVKAK